MHSYDLLYRPILKYVNTWLIQINLQIFRDGVEDTEQPGGAMLSNTDSKIIFGKIPPILEVHKEIKTDLENLLENWSDDVSVADVILSKVNFKIQKLSTSDDMQIVALWIIC